MKQVDYSHAQLRGLSVVDNSCLTEEITTSCQTCVCISIVETCDDDPGHQKGTVNPERKVNIDYVQLYTCPLNIHILQNKNTRCCYNGLLTTMLQRFLLIVLAIEMKALNCNCNLNCSKSQLN